MSLRLKTVFFGTPDFAVPSLEAALANSEVIAVVTQPDRPRGRGQQVLACPVKERAIAAGIPVFSPASLRKDSAEKAQLDAFFASHPTDLFCVTAYGNILPAEMLALPRLGAVNVHASLLPRWRGAAPIQRALEAGDTKTGVCLQKMVLEMDAGDVLAEKTFALDDDIGAGALTPLLSSLGGKLLSEFLDGFEEARLLGQAQKSELVTLAPKIKKEEGFWDPSWSATELHQKVRAFGAWPGVKARLESGLDIKLVKTRRLSQAQAPQNSPESGTLVLQGQRVLIGVRSGELPLELLEIQPANKGVVKAFDFLQNEVRRAAPGQSALRLLKPIG